MRTVLVQLSIIYDISYHSLISIAWVGTPFKHRSYSVLRSSESTSVAGMQTDYSDILKQVLTYRVYNNIGYRLVNV